MSAAIFRTDLSWPSVVAFEPGMRLGSGFRYPVYEQPPGPGGLPFDLERDPQSRGRHRRQARLVRGGPHCGGRAIHGCHRGLLGARRRPETPADVGPLPQPRRLRCRRPRRPVARCRPHAKRLERRPCDDPFAQVVEGHNDRAWRVVLESCRCHGKAGTVLDAARAMGAEGLEGGASGPGIETLVVMLGANNALGTVVHLDAVDACGLPRRSPRRRLDSKGAATCGGPRISPMNGRCWSRR